MSLNLYLTNHLIVQCGIPSSEFICSEAIVENPDELISAVRQTNYYISHVRWWDYVKIGDVSPIGYGGTRDPRNPNYYFAETDICRDFDTATTDKEYRDYLLQVKEKYSGYNILPAFDVKKP